MVKHIIIFDQNASLQLLACIIEQKIIVLVVKCCTSFISV